MIRRPPRSTRVRSSAASDVYKRQCQLLVCALITRLWVRRSASVGTQDLGAQHCLVEAQLAVELLCGVRARGEVDHRVDALGLLLDLEGEPSSAPDVDLVDTPAGGGDHRQVLVEGRGDGALLDLGIKDDHHLVLTHADTHLLWTQRSRNFRDRRVVRRRARVPCCLLYTSDAAD